MGGEEEGGPGGRGDGWETTAVFQLWLHSRKSGVSSRQVIFVLRYAEGAKQEVEGTTERAMRSYALPAPFLESACRGHVGQGSRRASNAIGEKIAF